MDCPECDERPVGLFHSFRLGGMAFKDRTKGYFECRNCGSTLKQKRSTFLFPKLKRSFWVAYPLLIILFAAFAGYILSYLGGQILATWQVFGLLGSGIFFTLGVSDELRYRFWVIEKGKPNNQNVPVRKLTKRGWGVFLTFTICSALLFIGAQSYIDLSSIGLTTYMAGYVLLLIGVLTGVFFILDKFSKAEVDT